MAESSPPSHPIIQNLELLQYDSDSDSLPPALEERTDADSTLSTDDAENTIHFEEASSSSHSQPHDLQSTSSNVQDRCRPGQLNKEWQKIFYTAFHNILRQQPEPEIYKDATTPPIIDVPNLPCGDPSKKKNRNALRIWSNNINGILAVNDYADLHELCTSLHKHKVDIICLQEINLDVTQSSVREKINCTFQEHFGIARVVSAASGV